jgi:hypothetical protein|tara:strand:+ start:238 stop:429 length:192 start_codon:yes stop_codon:yes gene_type:complete
MPKFTIDSIDYNTEDLSEHAKKMYDSLQYTLLQLKKNESEIEIYKIAHQALADALRNKLANGE